LIKSGYDFPDGLYEIGDEWNYFDDIYNSDGSFDGPGSEVIVNDPQINTEEEYIEIGNEIDFGGESPDITKFHKSEFDPSYFKSLEVGTFFHNTISNHEGSVEFEPIVKEDELKVWELTRLWYFGLFTGFYFSGIYFEGDWTHEISDNMVNGTLYIKTGEDDYSEVLVGGISDEISKEMGVDITTTKGDEDAIALCLKNKYKKK
jgi:hypothetical protein